MRSYEFMHTLLTLQIVGVLHDRMTQCRYLQPLTSFVSDKVPDPWYEVDVLGKGRAALEQVNDHLGKLVA